MKILVLSTWFPYPTNQGSKVRAYHLIKSLAASHEIGLISFEDFPVQPDWIEHMRQFCHQVVIVPRHPFRYSRIKIGLGLLSLDPSHVVAGYSSEMAMATQNLNNDWHPDLIFALTLVTAPYALQVQGIQRVVDVDNLLALMVHEQYSHSKGLLRRARRYLAYRKLLRYESRIYRQFDLALVCSQRDVERAARYIPAIPGQIKSAPNGVDLENMRPEITTPKSGALIFNGALTYEPNLDAMEFFLREIFPQVSAKVPQAHLRITGKTEGVPLSRLPGTNGKVIFTGYLGDIRPAVAASRVCVVPLRMGAGTRIKILEAMALGTPVVSTTKGAEGLEVQSGTHLLIADQPGDFAQQTLRLLQDEELHAHIRSNALQLVHNKYDWRQIGVNLCQHVEELKNR